MNKKPQSFNPQRKTIRRKCTTTKSRIRLITTTTVTDIMVICSLILLLIQFQLISSFNFMKEIKMQRQWYRHHCNNCLCHAIRCQKSHHAIQNKNNLRTLASSSSTAIILTQLNGIASRLYDMEAITESTTEFRDTFAFIDEHQATGNKKHRKSRKIRKGDGEGDGDDGHENHPSSYSSSFIPHDYNSKPQCKPRGRLQSPFSYALLRQCDILVNFPENSAVP